MSTTPRREDLNAFSLSLCQMKQKTITRSMASWFFLSLGIIACFSRAHGQPSTDGYISIDCGLPANTTYSDTVTGLQYISDDEFIGDAGVKSGISSNYLSSSLEQQLSTLRSFPGGARNCYALKVQRSQKYLLRATFMYGSYDGLNQASPSNPLQFDLYVDVNFWWTVNVTSASDVRRPELVFVAADDTVSVCLVKTGSATPFISALELRPLMNTMYIYANATQYLALSFRADVGPPPSSSFLRYPYDAYDRIWVPYIDGTAWVEVSTNLTVANFQKDLFEVPTVVMQTAATPFNSSKMEFYWDYDGSGGVLNTFYANLHMAELVPNTSRAFDIYLNDGKLYKNYTPPYLKSDAVYTTFPLAQSSRYRWALNSSGLSLLPPILNAVEAYTPMYLPNLPTDSGDVDTMSAIKGEYQLKKSWSGDPCVPRDYAWDGLSCSYGPNSARIANINLSSSALTGGISSFFAKLTELKSLDLSYNNLTGAVPDVLGSLSSLQVLNLTGNNLTRSIPASLLTKSQQGSLVLRIDGNPNLCANGNACGVTTGSKKKISTPIIVIICVVPAVLLLLFAAIFFVRRTRRLNLPANVTVRPDQENFYKTIARDHEDNPLQLENRVFAHKELEKITNNFERVLGKGGFGTVHLGCLQDGTQVAVKTRSESSDQGTKEFLAEVQNLVRIHHRNLVSMVGYCKEGDFLALVYEYMPEGTLQDHIRGKSQHSSALNWGKRLQIAIEAAEGLEYLHKGCKPPLVHRDVKTANILLNEKLEAKIADFGLTKAIQHDVTNIPTAVVGTPGYLDPEYYSTFKLSDKSDVYSFGVILFELITAEPPILATAQNAHIVQRVRQKLQTKNIEDIVDSKLQRDYDVNSIWKATEIAFRCTAQTSRERPSMTEIIMDLKDCLALESSHDRTLDSCGSTGGEICTESTEMSHNSAIEMERFTTFSPSAR